MGIVYNLNMTLGVDEGNEQCPSTYSYLHFSLYLYLTISLLPSGLHTNVSVITVLSPTMDSSTRLLAFTSVFYVSSKDSHASLLMESCDH